MKRIERVVLATLLALLSCSANADPLSYSFQVTATTGPLAGTVASGTFSFDDSIIPLGGGSVNQTGLLTDLNFTWNGVAYTEATANTGFLTFDPFGELLVFCFGTNAGPGGCSTDSNTEQWHTNSTVFIYSVAGINQIGIGPFTFQEIAVPEPGTAFLILAGLVILAMHRTRFWKRSKVAEAMHAHREVEVDRHAVIIPRRPAGAMRATGRAVCRSCRS